MRSRSLLPHTRNTRDQQNWTSSFPSHSAPFRVLPLDQNLQPWTPYLSQSILIFHPKWRFVSISSGRIDCCFCQIQIIRWLWGIGSQKHVHSRTGPFSSLDLPVLRLRADLASRRSCRWRKVFGVPTGITLKFVVCTPTYMWVFGNNGLRNHLRLNLQCHNLINAALENQRYRKACTCSANVKGGRQVHCVVFSPKLIIWFASLKPYHGEYGTNILNILPFFQF